MQIKHLILSIIIAALFVFVPLTSSAQFVNGKIYLGPHIAFSSYGGSVSLGANLELPITSPGSAGPGRIAIAGRGDVSFGYFGGNVILFSLLGNYHYSVAEDKLDLFAGIGLTFFSFSYAGYTGGSSIYPAIALGMRYFISQNTALRAQLGLLNYPYFTFGIDFGL